MGFLSASSPVIHDSLVGSPYFSIIILSSLYIKRNQTTMNRLVLDVNINLVRCALINIYGPNRDTSDFNIELKHIISNSVGSIIIGGTLIWF